MEEKTMELIETVSVNMEAVLEILKAFERRISALEQAAAEGGRDE